jgi:AAA+ superfamily predicted ATPase
MKDKKKTKRKQKALISRFDVSLHFSLPNEKERKMIFSNYAKHLSDSDLEKLAAACPNCSGRDIRDVCALVR